jgi:hypothetical protein
MAATAAMQVDGPKKRLAWPLLVLRPRGTPLATWITELLRTAASASTAAGRSSSLAAGGCAASGAQLLRQAAARAVTLCALEALEVAHAVGIAHCDVRPANIVIAAPDEGSGGSGAAATHDQAAAVLVDWGISAPFGKDVFGCGVPAYADERIFRQQSYAARPAQDAIGLLYTYLSIAYGRECEAPWLGLTSPCSSSNLGGDVATFGARTKWIDAHAHEAPVAPVAAALRTLQGENASSSEATLCAHIVRAALVSLGAGIVCTRGPSSS